MKSSQKLSTKDIFQFWSPLAMTWILMSIEGPFLASIIARMNDPKLNLASYGIAFAFALILEAPVMMLLSATLALVKDFESYLKMLKFTRVLNLCVFMINIVILYPPIYHSLVSLLSLPHEVEVHTYNALMLLLPWPVAIGFRRFYQGILMGFKLSKTVAVGTTIRLLCMFTTCCLGIYLTKWPGVSIGAISLSAGVVGEWLFVFFATRSIIKHLKNNALNNPRGRQLNYPYIFRFCTPLAMTSFIGLSVQPLVTFFVGLCKWPLESLAVLPVVNSFIFIFKCVGLSYQEVAIALIGEKYEGYHTLKRFCYGLALIFTLLLFFVAFTPLTKIWFADISGLSNELSSFAKAPLQIMAILPAFSVILCWQRAMCVNTGQNMLITFAAGCEFIVIIMTMSIFVLLKSSSGAVAASSALMLGRFSSFFYLWLKSEKIRPPVSYPMNNLSLIN